MTKNKKLTEELKRVTKGYIESNKLIRNTGTTNLLLQHALKIGAKIYQVFPNKLTFILKRRGKTLWLNMALSSLANPVGIVIAKNKNLSKDLLQKMGYPVPNSITVKSLAELKQLIKKIKFPVVVKPLGSAGGKGVTINIRNEKLLIGSFLAAKHYGKRVLIEQHLPGDYYRLTYIADGSYAATKNLPAFITGNGRTTAQQLIVTENKKIERAEKGRLNKIKITEKTKRFLATHGFTLSSILPKGKKIPLCFSGYDGGEYIDVTDKVHPYFKKLGKDVVDNLGLPIIGLDIITTDISKPLSETSGAIIEINGEYPDIQFHNIPTMGKSINLAPQFINYLFKKI
jgi:cyanophycin synthetase